MGIRWLVSGDPSCPACDSDRKFAEQNTERLKQKKIRYSFYDINTPQGAKIAGNSDAIPVNKICRTRRVKKGRKYKMVSRCQTLVGFDELKLKGVLGL